MAGPHSATSGLSLWARSCLRTSAILPVRLGVPHAHLGAVLGAATHEWYCALWALRDRPLANFSSWLHFLSQNEFQETLLLPRKLPAHVSWCSQDERRLGGLESRSVPRTGDSAAPAPRPTLQRRLGAGTRVPGTLLPWPGLPWSGAQSPLALLPSSWAGMLLWGARFLDLLKARAQKN